MSIEFLRSAFQLAKIAESEDEVPVGAVVVHEGKVIGRGHNKKEQTRNPIMHAEIIALQEAAKTLGSWRLLNCQLYVTLEPCPMCLAACQQARVAEVVFGTYDAKGGAISLGYKLNEDGRTNHRFKATLMDHEDCRRILKDYFAKKRNG